MHCQPRFAEAFATARITAFKPGQSPPPVIRRFACSCGYFISLCGQPSIAVFTNDCNGFFNFVYAMRDGEIDVAGKFVVFAEHRAATPFDEFGPHFSHQNERRVVKLADLEELPGQRHFQQSSNTTWDNYEGIGDNHEM